MIRFFLFVVLLSSYIFAEEPVIDEVTFVDVSNITSSPQVSQSTSSSSSANENDDEFLLCG